MVACPYLIRKRGMPVGVRVRDSFRRDIFDKIRGKFPGRCPSRPLLGKSDCDDPQLGTQRLAIEETGRSG